MTNISRRDLHRLFGAGIAVASMPNWVLADEAKPVKGGVLRIGSPGEPPIIVDILQNTGSAGTAAKVNEGLLTETLDGELVGVLAESWDISDDGLIYTFRLRRGVKWHDGKDFTSRDVAFSIKTLREVHPRRRATFAALNSIETPDDGTAIFKFSSPAPFLLKALLAWQAPIIAAHLYEGSDPRTNPINSAPIGTGPFRFVEWERGSHYYLEANPQYWDKDFPRLEGILVRFIPDAQSRAAAFEAGEIDIGLMNPLPIDEMLRLRDTGKFVLSDAGYNNAGTLSQLFLNLRTPVLQDLRVRQAIAHAIDVNEVVNRVWKGFAIPAATAISPRTPDFHDSSIAHYQFDQTRASALLDQAGYPRGSDGRRFSLRLTYNPASQLVAMAQYLRSALAEVGIDARTESFDFATYVRKIYTDGAFDLDLQTLVSGYDPTDGVQRAYHSSNIKTGLPWSNQTHYINPRVDEIFDLASREANFDKRRALYLELQQILYRDLPAVNLVSYQLTTVASTAVRDHTFDQSAAFQSCHKTWLSA